MKGQERFNHIVCLIVGCTVGLVASAALWTNNVFVGFLAVVMTLVAYMVAVTLADIEKIGKG